MASRAVHPKGARCSPKRTPHCRLHLYVGEGQAAEQEARRDLHNFNPSGYNPSHDSQGTPQTETNSIEQSASSIEHNSKLGGWINGFGPESNQLEINMSLLVQSQMVQAKCNAHYNLGSPPDSRHDPEAAPYNLGSPPDSRHDPEAAHYIKPALDTAPYNLDSPHDSRHDSEAALYIKPTLYNKPTLYTSPGGEADDFEYWMLYTRPPAMTSGGELVLDLGGSISSRSPHRTTRGTEQGGST